MENYLELIKQAFEIVTSQLTVRIVGTRYKFYAYQFKSDVDGKYWISFSYNNYPERTSFVAGSCEANLQDFRRIVDRVFLDKEIKVTIKE